MDNVNDTLLNRPKLDGTPEDEAAAAKVLRNETAEARTGGEEDSQDEPKGTIRQMINQARQAKENKMSGKPGVLSGSSSSPASKGTSQLLKMAWLNLLDSFGATLIYINIHVFGKSVVGEKIFCQLGEEWLPPEMQANKASVAVQAMIKKIGLLEKIVLVFLNLIVLCVVLILVAFIVILVSFLNKNVIVQGWTVFTQIFLPYAADKIKSVF